MASHLPTPPIRRRRGLLPTLRAWALGIGVVFACIAVQSRFIDGLAGRSHELDPGWPTYLKISGGSLAFAGLVTLELRARRRQVIEARAATAPADAD